MKTSHIIYEEGDHKWIAIARDPDKPDYFIDTIEYMIIKSNKACVLDPGGMEIFPSVFSVVGKEIETENIEFLFSSHQDPDVISSLSLWLSFNPQIKCYASALWQGFIPHYGCEKDALISIPDEGLDVQLNNNLTLQFIPAHYMHSSGNFHVYDAKAKILFTGDIGAALLPPNSNNSLFVENFSEHTKYMKYFHERWLPSNDAKNDWLDRVSKLDINMICPQHGSIFKNEDVKNFLQWFRDLKVGIIK